MRHVLSGGLTAAALGTALLVLGAHSASAQIARPQPLVADSNDSGLLTLVRGGGGGGGGGGSGSGGADRSSDRGGLTDRGDRGDRLVTPANSGSHHGGNQSAMPRTSRESAQVLRRDRDNDRRHHRRVVVRRGVFFDVGDSGSDDYAYASVYDQAVAYCVSRFHTYDLNTRTYIGKGGKPKPCP
jgi:hypothetical protein